MTALIAGKLRFTYWAVIAIVFLPVVVAQAPKEDYLSEAEVEKLREAQEPSARIKVLAELLEDRLDKARALKDPASIKPKSVEPKDGKKKASRGKAAPEAETKKTTEPAPTLSFAVWMSQYLQCLEEVAANLENFSSVPTEPKAYLKSLNSMDESLQEHSQWLSQLTGKFDREEKRVVDEVAEVLKEVGATVKSAVAETQERIKLLKETQKAKSSRR